MTRSTTLTIALLWDSAARCRRLAAAVTNREIAERLETLAQEPEQKAVELEADLLTC